MAPTAANGPRITLTQRGTQADHQHTHRRGGGHHGHGGSPGGPANGTVAGRPPNAGKPITGAGTKGGSTGPPTTGETVTKTDIPTGQPGQPKSEWQNEGFTPPSKEPFTPQPSTAFSGGTGIYNPSKLVDRQGFYFLRASPDDGSEDRLAVVYYKDTRNATNRQPDDWTWCEPKTSDVFYHLNLRTQSFPPTNESSSGRKVEWCIKAPHASNPTRIGDRCGVAVDGVRGYIIVRVAAHPLFRSEIDGVNWTFNKEYVCVDEQNAPTPSYPSPVWLCVTATSEAAGRKFGVGLYLDGSAVDQGTEPDNFAWLDQSINGWENAFNTASLTAESDFVCCINGDANLLDEHAEAGTAMYTQNGLIVRKDNFKMPVLEMAYGDESLTCYSSYYCVRQSSNEFSQGGFQ